MDGRVASFNSTELCRLHLRRRRHHRVIHKPTIPIAISIHYPNLSVTELKHLLSNRGIDFRDCLEKRDLVERLQQNYNNVKPLDKKERIVQEQKRAATNSQNKYTNEENVIIQTF